MAGVELVRATFRTAAGRGRERFGFLMATAVIVFVPLGFLGHFDNGVEFNSDDPARWDHLLTALALTLTALLGELFYAGAVASAVAAGPEFKPTLGEMVRHTPWLVILAIDILFSFAVAFGLVLFLVPGALIYARWVLAATVADIDHVGVREGFRTSAALTKGHRWAVGGVMFAVVFVSSLIEELIQHLADVTEGHGLLADWTSGTVSAIVLSPIFALLCAAFVLELRARQAPAAAETS